MTKRKSESSIELVESIITCSSNFHYLSHHDSNKRGIFIFILHDPGPLGLEKSRIIDFSLGKWIFMDPNALKSMSVYAKGSGTFDGTQLPSFFRSWQMVFKRPSI